MRGAFNARAVRSVGLGCIFGSILATAWHAAIRDQHLSPQFYSLLKALWRGGSFDGLSAYRVEIVILLLGAAFMAHPLGARLVRFFRAWRAGITSVLTWATTLLVASIASYYHAGLVLLWAGGSVTILVLAAVESSLRSRSATAAAAVHLKMADEGATERPPSPNVSDPIRRWTDDILGRKAVVELLAEQSLRLRNPVVALHGSRGDGKSSVLNLLRTAVQGEAVVVPFNAWLPGSEATLVTDLFRNIAAECRKVVSVPQLRKRTRAFVRTISSSVGYLAGLREAVSNQSQWEEVEELRTAFARVPKPILVLVDEIDRMQKEELLAFLKILRGADSIENVSFVCAFSDEEVREVTGLSSEYLEKFFPVSVRLSSPSAETVFAYMRRQLLEALEEQHWFSGEIDSREFTQQLEQLWADSLSGVCTNLRKAALLKNDVAAVGRSIAGEVDPIDLVGIEAIRRFFPSIYPTIRANPQHLTDKRKDFFEEDRKSEKFYKDLDQDVDKLKEAKALRALLNWLFPKYAAHSGDRSAIFFGSRRPAQGSALERSMRICVADYFEVYFRASVPEEMFSNTDLEAFIKELNAAPRERSVGSAFNKIFDATPKGHPKRNDFLWRLSRKLDRLDDIPAESLAYAVATRAKDYTYDSLGLGEFGHALAIVFSAAQKISATGAIQRLLEGAVARASDDAFAFNLLDNVGTANGTGCSPTSRTWTRVVSRAHSWSG